MSKLKELAKNISGHLNREFRDSQSQVYNENSSIKLTCSKFLELEPHLSDALALPGLPFGQITQVYGKKDAGKSSFLQQCIVSCQKQGVLPILILTEPKFDAERIRKYMGGDPEELLIIQVDSLEDGFSKMDRLLTDLKDGFIVCEDLEGNDFKVDLGDSDVFFFWDSIGGTISTAEMEYAIEDHDKDMGRFAKALKSMVKKIWQKIVKCNDKAGALFLNQVWTSRTHTGIAVEKPYGGESVQHYYALEVRLKKSSEISMQMSGKKTAIGYNTEMIVMKNHLSPIRNRTPLCAVASGLILKDKLNDFKKTYLKLLKEK